jgi:hypothetical protein
MMATKPVRQYSALVDLLDRALTKGLLITADVVISVADVPLIGLNLRLALANMETMLAYGLMRDWDQKNNSVNVHRCLQDTSETGFDQNQEGENFHAGTAGNQGADSLNPF